MTKDIRVVAVQAKVPTSKNDIYLPGEKSFSKYKSALSKGTIEIEPETWERLKEFSLGEDVKGKVGLKQNEKGIDFDLLARNSRKQLVPMAKNGAQKKGYEVSIPDLPTIRTDLPDMEEMLKIIKVDRDTVVIGHSLGALLGLRLAERQKFRKLILVSGWDFDDGSTPEHRLFWPNKIDHDKIKKNVREFIVIHSNNDPYTPAHDAEEMSKRLNGKFILVPNGGHLSEKEGGRTDLPEILSYI